MLSEDLWKVHTVYIGLNAFRDKAKTKLPENSEIVLKIEALKQSFDDIIYKTLI